MQLVLAAFASVVATALGGAPCSNCAEFCKCVNAVAPSNLLSQTKVDAAYESCNDLPPLPPGDPGSAGIDPVPPTDDDDFQKQYNDYQRCTIPECSQCSKTIETVYRMETASRKKREIREKRQGGAGAIGVDDGMGFDYNEYHACAAKKLGMTSEELELYESQLNLANSAVNVCNVYLCGQTFAQYTKNDESCMKKHNQYFMGPVGR